MWKQTRLERERNIRTKSQLDTVTVYIDFKKAFDKVNHNILRKQIIHSKT